MAFLPGQARRSPRKVKGPLAFVTGDAEVDAVLANFSHTWQKQQGRKAGRDAAKLVLDDFKQTAPMDTGAMAEAAVVRSAKRSRKQAFGFLVYVDRKRLFSHATSAGKELSVDKRDGGPYYWPAVIEFGDHDTPAQRPLRSSLWQNQGPVRELFLASLRRHIAGYKFTYNAKALETSMKKMGRMFDRINDAGLDSAMGQMDDMIENIETIGGGRLG